MAMAREDTNGPDKRLRLATAVLDGHGFRVCGEGSLENPPSFQAVLPFIYVTCPVCNTKSLALKADLKREGTTKCVICGHRYKPDDDGESRA